MKTPFLFLICLGMMCCVSCERQGKLAVPNLDELYTSIWKTERGSPKMPTASCARVLFFDLNNDGVLDALVGYCTEAQRGDGKVYRWTAYQYKDGEWQCGKDQGDGGIGFITFDNQFHFFHILTTQGQKPKLIWAAESLPIENYILVGTLTTQQVVINDDGYLRRHPLPGIVENGHYYADWCVEDIYSKGLKPSPYKLEPVPIEKFHVVQRKDTAQEGDTADTDSEYPEYAMPRIMPRKGIPILTREEIIRLEPENPDLPDRNRSRNYCEVDLTGNGLKDIIISEPLGMSGMGGSSWTVYICISTNQYQEANVGLSGRTFAFEDDNWEGKRIWAYWHLSSNSGAIEYLQFNRQGEGTQGPSIEIYTDGDGSGIGGAIFEAIFNERNLLRMRRISPASPTNDLPLIDVPDDDEPGDEDSSDEEE